MIEVSVALVGIVLTLWLAWRWKHTSLFTDLGIPGPKPSLFFGNILELYRKGPLVCHEEWVKKYGRVVGYYYGMKRILLVADPHLLKNVYIKDFTKFVNREPFNPIGNTELKTEIEQSVLNLKGQKWKEVRSVLTPTFTTVKMKQMAITMNTSIGDMLSILEAKATKKATINILDTYQRLTMDVIGKTAFGIKLDIQTNTKSGLLSATQLFFRTPYNDPLVFFGLVFPWLRSFAFFCQRMLLRVLNRGISPFQMLSDGVAQVIQHRKTNEDIRKPDLLQLMLDTKITLGNKDIDVRHLEAGDADIESAVEKKGSSLSGTSVTRNMRDDEIIASSVTVFLAGYETTSTALAFTSYLLAKNVDIQDKVFDEICDLVQSGAKLEYSTINKLAYLDQVFNESMRLYPPVYLFTNRFALEDVQYGDLKIPEGMIVQAPTYLLHHDPEYWSDPETFNPDRFDTKPNSDGVTFFPFGIGPRNCLGMRFAQMEAKLTLAHIIYNFKLKLAKQHSENLPLTLRVRTLAPTGGINLKLEARHDKIGI